MTWTKTGTTQYHALLGLPEKGRTIKGFVVCNNWDLEPLDLLNGLALGCYPSSPEVLIFFISSFAACLQETIKGFWEIRARSIKSLPSYQTDNKSFFFKVNS